MPSEPLRQPRSEVALDDPEALASVAGVCASPIEAASSRIAVMLSVFFMCNSCGEALFVGRVALAHRARTLRSSASWLESS